MHSAQSRDSAFNDSSRRFLVVIKWLPRRSRVLNMLLTQISNSNPRRILLIYAGRGASVVCNLFVQFLCKVFDLSINKISIVLANSYYLHTTFYELIKPSLQKRAHIIPFIAKSRIKVNDIDHPRASVELYLGVQFLSLTCPRHQSRGRPDQSFKITVKSCRKWESE